MWPNMQETEGLMSFTKEILSGKLHFVCSGIWNEYVWLRYRPANICWSWRRLQHLSWKRLQHVFNVTILRLPRRIEDVLKTSCKTSWRRLARRKIVTLKTSWRRLEDMAWRRLEDNMEKSKILTGDICI